MRPSWLTATSDATGAGSCARAAPTASATSPIATAALRPRPIPDSLVSRARSRGDWARGSWPLAAGCARRVSPRLSERERGQPAHPARRRGSGERHDDRPLAAAALELDPALDEAREPAPAGAAALAAVAGRTQR